MAKQSKQAPAFAARFTHLRPLLERAFFVLALLGALVTVHLAIQQSRGFDQGCWGFNPAAGAATFDCQAVVQSGAGSMFGISNVYLGILFYLLLAGLTALVVFGAGNLITGVKQVRAGIVATGVLFSLYLVYYQYAHIGEFCALCLTSAGIVGLIAGVQVLDLRQPPVQTRSSRKKEVRTYSSAFYPAVALVILVLVGGDLLYFNHLGAPSADGQEVAAIQQVTEYDLREPAPGECFYDPNRDPVENFRELISLSDAVKGNARAPVTVIEYFDPNCSHCKALYPIMNEVASRHEEHALFVYKPVVIVGQQSVGQVAALHAAAQSGVFHKMLELQFAKQKREGFSVEELRLLARQAGLDAAEFESRLMSNAYAPQMRQQRFQFEQIGLTGVPAVLINGRVVAPSSRTVGCLSQLIEQAREEVSTHRDQAE